MRSNQSLYRQYMYNRREINGLTRVRLWKYVGNNITDYRSGAGDSFVIVTNMQETVSRPCTVRKPRCCRRRRIPQDLMTSSTTSSDWKSSQDRRNHLAGNKRTRDEDSELTEMTELKRLRYMSLYDE